MDTNSLDESIHKLKARKDEWARLAPAKKSEYLRGVIDRHTAVAAQQVEDAGKAKGTSGALAAEDWSNGPYCTVRYASLLLRTLAQIATHGRPEIQERAIRTRPDGQVIVRVFPSTAADKLLYAGFWGDVWMRKEVTRGTLRGNMGGYYRQKDPVGKVAVVLGAGNVASIAPLDVLNKLYVEGQVCLLKLNPVNEYLGPHLVATFADLIRDGFIQIAAGGADVGEYLCQHPDVEEIHITGSHLTHDAIVYGSGEAGRKRKQEGSPRLTKRITSELGNVSPVVVVPGPWSVSDLKFQAENIATQMINNCGFNCCAAKVLILPQGWSLGGALMDEVRAILAQAPQRKPYYPGAEERFNRFTSSANAVIIGERAPGVLPWALIPDLDPNQATHPCYTTESFCGVMAQTSLPCGDAMTFLRNSIAFCNERLWGTLSACVLIHPKTERALGPAFEDALADLRYGSIGVNHWPVLSFVWGATTWGAFPGHTTDDVQSGIGCVHNAHLFDNPERSLIYGPFRVWPKPAWFIGNRKAAKIFPKLVQMEARPGAGKVLGIMMTAMGG